MYKYMKVTILTFLTSHLWRNGGQQNKPVWRHVIGLTFFIFYFNDCIVQMLV